MRWIAQVMAPLSLMIVAIIAGMAEADTGQKDASRIQKRSLFEWKFFDVNTINCTISSAGPYADYSRTGQAGLEWPKGSGKTAVFTAGIWIIGRHGPTDSLRTAVQYYQTEFKPGPILGTFNTTTNDPSVAADPNDPRYRVYKINRTDSLSGGNPDYDEWPGNLGAPYVDVNSNGVWDPGLDKPEFSGNQQLWVVYNDVNPQAHANTGVTAPMGIEVQALYFGFDRPGVLENTMFVKWLIINKSDAEYRDIYFSMWSDTDLGDANDDLSGVDTTLDLAFVYNGDDFDGGSLGYGDRPPADGFLLLEGPIVPGEATDSAKLRGVWRKGFRNLRAVAYVQTDGSPFTDPYLGDKRFARTAYGYLQGLNGSTGQPIIDPTTNRTSTFVFSGDPVAGIGWLPGDSNVHPSDLRNMLSTGPFTLAVGDSQEVVGAFLIAQGNNRLSSVTELKRAACNVRNFYESGFTRTSLPALTHSLTYNSPAGQTTATVRLSEPDAISARAFFVPANGSPLDSIDLYDDGSHSDGAAGDGLWANSWTTVPLPYGVSVDLRIEYVSGQTLTWRTLVTRISTAGPVRVGSYSVASDNVNADGRVNPGENIRYVYSLTNGGAIAFSDLRVKVEGVTDSRVSVTPDEEFQIPSLGAQATASLVYDENDPTSYFSFTVPEDITLGAEFSILLEILDMSENRWEDTLKFTVEPYAYAPIANFATHAVGNSEGTFGVLVVDYPALKDHTYEIRAVDSVDAAGDVGFTLIDVTDGRTLLERHPLPDDSGHNVQVTDGFKVTKGTALYPEEYPGPRAKDWSYSPSENRFITGKATSEVMDTFLGGLAYPRVGVYVNKGTTVAGDSLKRVEIIFSDQNREKAYRYLTRVSASTPLYDASFTPYVLQRGSGYVYQDYVEVPFTAWEVDPFDKDATPRQLNVAFLERNDSLYSPTGAYLGRGKIDGQWYPTTADNGGGEVVYIFASTYSDQENSFYTGKNLFTDQNNLDILYVLWARLDGSLPQVFREGDVFTIYPQYPPVRGGNVYSFNPVLLEVRPQGELPSEYALYQNYPNPFNPTTTIRYELPKESRVKLEIYNILGQKVATPVDEEKNAGRYEVRWDAARFSTGVYFYRLQAGEFREMKKLMLLR